MCVHAGVYICMLVGSPSVGICIIVGMCESMIESETYLRGITNSFF